MKILHFSDTHLWFSLDNSLREDDFYNSFLKVIDYAIENKVKYVIHSWDLFHYSKPSNKALSVCVQGLLSLSKNWIKVIMIAWNHSTPRLSTTTHPFDIFNKIENIFTINWSKTEKLKFDDVNFVWLPHINSEEKFKHELSISWDYFENWMLNIYTSHFWISAQNYDEYTDEISWINIKKEDLESLKKYDYVAMWHYHKNFKIWNIHYSGSLEHTSFNQKNNKTWFNILEIKNSKIEKIEFVENKSRDMVEFNFDCSWINLTSELIEKLNIENFNIKDKIVKFNFLNLNTNLILEFKDNLMQEYFKNAFYFEYRKIKAEIFSANWKSNFNNSDNFIKDSFEDFWSTLDNFDESIDKEKIKKEIINKLK